MPYQKREYTNFIIYTYAISKTWIHYFHYIYLCHIKNVNTLISLYIPMPYQKHGYINFHYIYLCHIKNMNTLISLYIPMPYQKREYISFIIYTYAISKT